MKVTFYYRTPNILNRSIERVFELVQKGLAREGVCVKSVYARSCRFWPLSMIWNMMRSAWLSYSHSGIHHITGDIQYCAIFANKRCTILTIHDLVSLHNDSISPIIRHFIYYLWYYFPIRHLRYITCISEATHKDILQLFPFAKDKITVVPNPVDDEFFNINPQKVISEKPIILHIGTRENKNLLRVIESLSGIKCHLRIIGVLTEEQKNALLQFGIEYSCAQGLSDSEIIDEYRSCDIVSFPSTFEGFGMPIIEAQASARPVVCSEIEPMLSISGGNAVFVDPFSVESIRNGFKKVIEDPFETVEKGRMNAQSYKSTNIVKKYKELYDKILNV